MSEDLKWLSLDYVSPGIDDSTCNSTKLDAERKTH
jgi:hypothetical protein